MLDKKYPREHKLITSAVSANVFMDEDRHPLENLEESWSTDMDAFYIMVSKYILFETCIN
jgi:chitinase